MDQNKNFYETQSLLLGATLISLGIHLDSIFKNPEGKSIFIFLREENLDEILNAFWKKSLSIEPNLLWESIRFLKSRIYGG